MNHDTLSILCVDDEPGILDAYRQVLQPPEDSFNNIIATPDKLACPHNINLLLAASGEEAIRLLTKEMESGTRVAVGFFDVRMPGGMDGYETIRQVRALDPEIYCAVVTAFTDRDIRQLRDLFGASHQDHFLYFKKPFSSLELEQTSINLISSWHRKHNEELLTATKNKAIEALRQEVQERRQAEAKIRQWHQIFNHAGWGVVVSEDGETFKMSNPAFAMMHGYTLEEIPGKKIIDIFPPDADYTELAEHLRLAKEQGHYSFETRHTRKDGSIFPVSVDLTAIQTNEGRSFYAANIKDISESKALEQQLAQAKVEWEEVFDTIHDAITIHDLDFNILRANKAAVRLLNTPLKNLIGNKCHTLYHGTACPPNHCPSCRSLQTGTPISIEMYEPYLKAHFEIKALPRYNKNGTINGLIHVVRDISARKLAEDKQQILQSQLIQAQKMESVGLLAGGVAHDFNNLLSGINGFTELSLMKLQKDSPIREYLTIVKEAGTKAAALTSQLLAFSRKQILEPTVIDLGTVVENISKMLVRTLGENIAVELTIPENLPNVLADTSQIEQVLLNLAVNARDAMQDGGRFSIELKPVEMTEDMARFYEGAMPGRYVQLTSTDTGLGMPLEIQEKIFEPFFTTKEKGKGTGLGLATVYGIIKQHEGFISVSSQPGRGTTFTILLPASESETALKAAIDEAALLAGNETILIADDDNVIRRLLRDILTPLGYHILMASSGEQAIQLSRAHNGTIALLLTDVIMTGISGRELANTLQKERPDMRLVFMSGYTADRLDHHKVLIPGTHLIHKPISPSTLVTRLREILDTPEDEDSV